MYDPTTIAAIINLASQLLEPIVKVAIDYLGKRMNKGTSKKTTPSAQRESTAGGLLRLLVGTMGIHFFRREISTQKAEQLDFEKRIDEAISTYSRNLQLIKLVHGFGSVFLLIILPYAGAWVPLVMVLSFFFVFYCYIAYKEINDKIERMSELEKKPLSRLKDIQNEVANLGKTVEAPFSGDECESYAEMGVLDGLKEYKDSMKRDVYALQQEITRIVESSENSRVSQIMSLAQVNKRATIYGICFPILPYFLFLMGFRGDGLSGTMQKY